MNHQSAERERGGVTTQWSGSRAESECWAVSLTHDVWWAFSQEAVPIDTNRYCLVGEYIVTLVVGGEGVILFVACLVCGPLLQNVRIHQSRAYSLF